MKNKAIVKDYNSISKPHLVAIVIYRDENDTRKKKYFTTLKEAQRFADKLNFQAEKFGKQAKNISEEDTQDLILAKRDLTPFNISPKDAIRTYIELSNILEEYNTSLRGAVEHFIKWNDKKAQSTTLTKAVDEYLESLKCNAKSLRHITTIDSHLKRFVDDFKPNCIVAMIDALKIEQWIKSLKVIIHIKANPKEPLKTKKITSQDLSPQTKNNYRASLSSFFAFCFRRNYITANPIDKVEKISIKMGEPKIYSVKELSSMLNCSEELSQERLFIALGAFAGLRTEEIKRLSWRYIHFDEKEIVVDASITKTNQRRIVEISDNLLEWLKPYISHKLKGGLLFPSEGSLRNALEKFREAYKITWIDNGLRHSSASYHLALTQNANLTAERMGHSVAMLKKHYMGLVRPKEAKAYWNITPQAKSSIIDAGDILKEGIA